MLATDTGSRIGVIFVKSKDNPSLAEMHFIVNGDDFIQAIDIPYKESNLFVVGEYIFSFFKIFKFSINMFSF